MSDWLEKVIAGAAAALLSWAVWVTRRQFSYLSRAEHRRICEEHNAAIMRSLEKLERGMTLDRAQTQRHRDALNERLGKIETKVAVLDDRSERDSP